MPRHARPNEEPAAHAAAGPVADEARRSSPSATVAASSPPRRSAVTTPVQVATPTGRRARPAQTGSARLEVEQTVAPDLAPAETEPPALAHASAAGAPTTGSGRRRKPAAAEPVAPAAATAPGTGRRRKSAAETTSSTVAQPSVPEAAAPAAPGTGRRRKPSGEPAQTVAAAQTVESAAPATGRRAKPAVQAAPSSPVRRTAPAVVAPPVEAPAVAIDEPLAPVVPITAARRAAGSTGARRKAKARTFAVPGAPAIVAGAAAVAVAAVGALGAAGSGAGAGSSDLSRASAAGLSAPGNGVSLVEQQALAERNETRASRDRARKALAKRQKEAATKKAKQLAAAKALKLAKERAARLARLAKAYRMPVQGYRLTAGFGQYGLWSAGHTGTDFACPYGTAIRAIGSGRIVSAGWDGAYGWKTVQVLNDGTEIWYAHQSKMLVKSGYVNAGDVIGRVGSTGRSTGPHLHLEVRVNGKPVNPIPWMKARGLLR